MTFRVALINVPGHPEDVLTVSPPAGILSLAAVAREGGLEVQCIDADAPRLGPSAVVRRLRRAPPDLVGFSLNVSQVAFAGPYLEAVLSAFPDAPLVAGGPYVTGVGEGIFRDFPDLAFAVVHEGEYALLGLVEHLRGDRAASSVRNLLHRTEGGITCNAVERIENPDVLPFPAYSLLPPAADVYPGAYPSLASPSAALLCARGCPFECAFCSSPKNWGRRVTFRSPEKIVEELRLLRERFGVREVFFQDDTMNLRGEWFTELCGRIRSRGLHETMTFKAPFKAGAKLLGPGILDEARRANFWMIYFGVENGDPDMLRSMKKKVTVEEIEDAFRLTHEAGMATFASFMVGNPGETKATVEASLALAGRIRPDFGGFAVAAPFPGSELHDRARKAGHVIAEDFKTYRFGECILRTETLPCAEISALACEANRRLDRITKLPPEGSGAGARARYRKTVARRYGPLGLVGRFGLRGLIRRYGVTGLLRKGLGRLGRPFRRP